MRSILSSPLIPVAAAFFALVPSACHSHDDGGVGAATNVPPGSSGAFVFEGPGRAIRGGEFGNFLARNLGDSTVADIASWTLLSGPDGALVDVTDPGQIRLVAGTPGFYSFRATGVDGRTGTFGFNVVSALGQLRVTEVVGGSDTDDVRARLATVGTDLFIAERIGDATAPQVIARTSLAAPMGDRNLSVQVPYKIVDIAAAENGQVMTLETAATSLTAGLRRYGTDLNQDTNFTAFDLGTGETWANAISMTRDAQTVVATSLGGGSLLFLGQDGAPVLADGTPLGTGDIATALRSIPFQPAEIVDLATDSDGSAYVATATEIIRVLPDGSTDSVNWTPGAQTAITAISCDERGILYVIQQDQEGGQCGSLRKINWLGGETAFLSEFTSGTFFAARKFLMPVDVAAFPDGSWRVYDDTVSIDQGTQHAAWIVAGNAPVDPTTEQ